MEKNDNPNSSWSELPPDLVISVFERLCFANFQRAKSVCSSWYSASRQVVPKSQIALLILFPKDKNNNNSCTLLNLEEKYKLYKTQDLGVEFTKSVCLATYGSWLLMQDPLYNLYIVNLFSHERINLPPLESQLGMIKMERHKRTLDDEYYFIIFNDILSHAWAFEGTSDVRSPVFWIDEKTKDYVVLWGLKKWCVVYSKKGDTSWNQIPETSNCLQMVYKDHKLYFSRYRNIFTIVDFSGEIPQQTFQCALRLNTYPWGYQVTNPWNVTETKLVVTITGDVLRVERMLRSLFILFRICKIYSSGFFKKYEIVDSLGDEAMLFDLGITVLANEVEGLNRNSIYFSDSHDTTTKDRYLFSLERKMVEPLLHNFDLIVRYSNSLLDGCFQVFRIHNDLKLLLQYVHFP